MRQRTRHIPAPIHAADGYSRSFPDKWRAHHKRQRDARAWKLAAGKVKWLSLPPRHDPKHPRGLLVGRSSAVPELRAYLGFEKNEYGTTWRPAERLFLDTSVFATDPSDWQRYSRGIDLHYRRRLDGGLGVLVRQALVWFVCREDSRSREFASPGTERWHHPIP